MTRPIEFEKDKAIESAMLLFWRQGYSATSLSQLLKGMKISRSSFYAAFGDKRTLYIECLSLFADRTYAILHEVRNEENSIEAIKLFFEHTLFQVPERRVQRGCMLVNTVLELADVDDGLSQIASARLGEIEKAFEECFQAAVHSGQLSKDQSPKLLAQFIMTINQGLRVSSRKKTNKKQLKEILNTTLSLLSIAA